MNINVNKISEWCKYPYTGWLGPCIATGIIGFCLWWSNSDDRDAFSGFIAFLFGFCFSYLVGTIAIALKKLDDET